MKTSWHLYLAKITHDNLKGILKQFENHLVGTDRGGAARSYLGDVRRFAEWISARHGAFSHHAVSPLDLVQYRQALQEARRSSATINRALVSLKVFFGWLSKQKTIRDNPADCIKPVAVSAPPAPKWLNRNQQAALMRAVRERGNPRDEALVGIMLHAGLRVGEVCALTREDLMVSERAGRVIVRKGKGNKYREVPLNKTIRKTLSCWLDENKKSLLFPNKNGSPITSNGVYRLVEKYAYLAKLESVTPHTLRHTFCKNLIDMNVPIDQVAVMAGHSSLETTRRYTVPGLLDLQAAVERTAWE